METANPSAYRRLRAAIRDFRPQVVHANIFLTQLSPLVLPLLRDVPSIYHVRWYRAVCPRGTKLLPDATECRVRAGRACRHNRCLTRRAWVLAEAQRALLHRWFDVFDRVLAISERVQRRLELDGLRVDGVLGVAVEPRGPRPPLAALPPRSTRAGSSRRRESTCSCARSRAHASSCPRRGSWSPGTAPSARASSSSRKSSGSTAR